MRLLLRPVVPILLATLAMSACSHWRPRLEPVRETLAEPGIRHLRLTRTDRQQVEMRVAEIRGDTVYGTIGGSGPLSCVEASASCSVRLPVSEIGFVEVRSFSAVRTVTLVIVPVGIIAVALLASDNCQKGVDC